MGKIVSNFFISFDGVVEAPNEWHFPYFNDEMGAVIGAGMSTAGAFMMGRTLYEEWSSYWPNHAHTDAVPAGEPQEAADPFADFINNIPKYVVSNTLDRSDVEQHHARLRRSWSRRSGRSSSAPRATSGSRGAPRSSGRCIANDLLDELQLLVHPIVVGHGQRLFEDGSPTTPLKLINHAVFTTGVLHLGYAPQPSQ